MTASLRPIRDIARDLGIHDDHLVPYGSDKAKVRLDALEASSRAPGKLILVTAVTPTDAGEGKTVTSIGLSQGLAKEGQRVCLALREPSLGPTFGMKGGATGGGLSTVEPKNDINLHFNGDFHAISTANNLLAAVLDNHLDQGNALGINPRRVLWKRVVDLNDRALRQIVSGLGGLRQGVPRETGFDITPASEIMAVLCLAQGEEDLRQRLGRIIVAQNHDKQPVTAADLKVVGALMVLLRDALMPNLVQTAEGVPAFIHGGPFANIAHGCNSVLATRMAMAHGDWTVTEAGFAADLGAEKFLDVKCQSAGLDPAAIVVVATVKALKRHGGMAQKDLDTPDLGALEAGLDNLRAHIENLKKFGRTPVVAINRFPSDSDAELELLRKACDEIGVRCALSEVFARGGDGGRELARAVLEQAEEATEPYTPLYDWNWPIEKKVEAVATRIYGADGVDWTGLAKFDLRKIKSLGYGELPICIAKTQKSISDDPKLINRPTGFTVTVRRVVLSAGAGFAVPILGDILRMPGLPKVPQAENVDLVNGEIVGVE
ncbi:MAG: formate--tetrahydrofolate ligase [Thermoanaerobaculia bacterium]|nr:formate--tetrahydrofolate ligase [Thermoanaerobaculia bacterium]